jgi:hypothetical protein
MENERMNYMEVELISDKISSVWPLLPSGDSNRTKYLEGEDGKLQLS